MRGYLSLTRKNSITDMHGHTVDVKEGLPFTPGLSLRTLRILIYDFVSQKQPPEVLCQKRCS